MSTTKFGRNLVFALSALPLLLTGCGGSSGDDSSPSNDDPVAGVEEGLGVSVPNFEFQLDENFFNTSSAEYVELIDDQIGGAIVPLNSIDNVFMNNQVAVIYGDCGVANAFYVPLERQIVICDELASLAFNYFRSIQGGDTEGLTNSLLRQTFSTMTFILYHEMGHALDDLRDLSIGGNFESVADAIAVVLSVQTEQPLAVVDAGLFFFANTDVSFADEHGSGEDRSGDIFCWVIGSSPFLSTQLPTISEQFVNAGRDCVAEYANQFDFVSQLVPNLESIPPRASFESKLSDAEQSRIAALDRLVAERLRSISLQK